MSRENMSIADRFIAVMADIERMDHGMKEDAEERYAIWRLQEAARAVIEDGLRAAQRCIDSNRLLIEAAGNLRRLAEQGEGKEGETK